MNKIIPLICAFAFAVFAQQPMPQFDILDCDCKPKPDFPNDPEQLSCICSEAKPVYVPPPPPQPQAQPAQPVEKPPQMFDLLGFQIRGGLFDFYHSKDFDEYLNLGFGLGLGLSVNYEINSKLAIAPEFALYYRSLYTIDAADLWLQKTTIAEFALSIPVMIRYMPIDGKAFYVEAGPQIDIPVWTFTHNDDEIFETYKDRSTFDLGLAVGAGYYITKGMAVDLRAVFGMASSLSGKSKDKTTYNQYLIGIRF